MVEAYFACTEANCTQAILTAYHKYVDYATFDFNPYTRCAFTNFNEDCAQVLVQNRPTVYGSADNILVALLTCAKYKAEARSGKVVRVLLVNTIPVAFGSKSGFPSPQVELSEGKLCE